MVVRVLAVLVTLGLLLGSAQAHTPSTPVAVLVDQVDEADDVDSVVTTASAVEESRAAPPHYANDAPAGHEPCRFLFRPPRTYAFN